MWTKDILIWCDVCNVSEQTGMLGLSTVESTRKDLKDQGWTFKNGEDKCSGCSGKNETKTR